MLRQDDESDRLRRGEALTVAAGRLALDIERKLQEIEDRLARGEGMALAPDGPISTLAQPLLYLANSQRLGSPVAQHHPRSQSIFGCRPGNMRSCSTGGLKPILRRDERS
jgi:hypothetical protein